MSMAEMDGPLTLGLLIQWGDQADPCTGVVFQAGKSIRLKHGHLVRDQRCLYLSAWAKAASNVQGSLQKLSGISMASALQSGGQLHNANQTLGPEDTTCAWR